MLGTVAHTHTHARPRPPRMARPITRAQFRESAAVPVPLTRMTAMRPVHFTTRGRRLARRLCLDDRATYLLSMSDDGVARRYHLHGRDGMRSFDGHADVPDYVVGP